MITVSERMGKVEVMASASRITITAECACLLIAQLQAAIDKCKELNVEVSG